MAPLKTTDDDEMGLEADDDKGELAVRYELGDESPLTGMLPLFGISTSADLLVELAEFGSELQDDVILNVNSIEACFYDGVRVKSIGPRTAFDSVVTAGEVTVRLTKQQPSRVHVTAPPHLQRGGRACR